MKYIIVLDDNFYNRTGIYSLFNGRLSGVRFLDSANPENFAKASLIICSFVLINKVSSFLCQNKQYNPKIICMTDKSEDLNVRALPSCLNNIMLISSDITVLNFYNLVVNCLTSQTNSYQRNNCDSCVKNYFSPQQLNILSRFFDGQSVSEISNELMVSKSTIYSHKRYVMTRYNLRTKHELYFFWKLVNNRIRDS